MPKFNVEDVSPIERRIKVEVEPERVQAELDRITRGRRFLRGQP